MSAVHDENPFGFGQGNPFAFGVDNDNNDDAGHVVPNPFGLGNGDNNNNNAAADPFAFGNHNENDHEAPAHVVANPFAFGGGAAADPFAFGNQQDAAAAPGHVVANPFGFGVMNPFGIANDGPQDELDLSQQSLGESFLAGHMNRLSEETSMKLSQDEGRWAKELKAAAEASNDVPHITDMEIAQHAIVHQGNVFNALVAIKSLAEFKRLYYIQDTPEEGLQAIQSLLDQQQGAFLDLDTNSQTQETSLVVDLKAFHPNKSLQLVPGKTADHSFRVLARGIYYLYKATTSSLSAARNGLFLVVDCDGIGWENCNQELDQRLHAELLSHLPLQWKKIMAYSTALVASVWWGLIKRMVSKQFTANLEKGCRLVDTDPSKPPRRIADMYRQPDLKTVQAKLERSAQNLLRIREDNEQEFQIITQNVATADR